MRLRFSSVLLLLAGCCLAEKPQMKPNKKNSTIYEPGLSGGAVAGKSTATARATLVAVASLAVYPFGIGPALAQPPLAITAADYARAEQWMPYRTNQLVLNAMDTPRWLPSGKFWYRTRTAEGFALFIVDPIHDTRQVAFDEQKMSRSVRIAGKAQHKMHDLPLLDEFELLPDEKSLAFHTGSRRWTCDTEGAQCSALPDLDRNALRSPDGRHEVFIRDFNLWVREVATGNATRLTSDGSKDLGYATDNSSRRHSDRAVALWSPDSRRIATFQQDQRGVGEMYLVKTQRGHPQLETWKYAMPGDAVIPTVERVIIDIDTQRTVRLQMPPDLVRSASWLGLADERTGVLEAQWSSDASRLAFISMSRDHKCARLRLADAATGAVRDILEECAPKFYESAPGAAHALRGANWQYLDTSGEVIWYSSRDRWNHLYLYDAATGKLRRQITSGDWNVSSLVRVDERERAIYFTAVGREPGRNPYFEHLYRIGFDGNDLTLLTPEDATHVISVAPSGEYFVDSFSRADLPPVSVLRDRNGRLIRTIEKADISRLVKLGWKPPAPIMVKARDGVTDLYGLMFRPSNFDENRTYPILNAIYSAPIHGSIIPYQESPQWGAFSAAYGALGDAQSLAELGFVVVMIDGMGTPHRSREFHESTYGNYGDATLPDQIAGMQQLARRYKWIDIDRSGIFGVSHGGYAAARALFTYPEFFKVGVAISGNHDPLSYMDEYTEKFMGLVHREADGTTSYDSQDNLGIAKNLQGHLLLIHGTMDDNVSPYQTLLLVQALIDANKDFDLLMLPNQPHGAGDAVTRRYVARRYWDYFVRHLLRASPPKEYQMGLATE